MELQDALNRLKGSMPQMEKLLTEAKAAMSSLKPNEEKNVVVDGLNCVLQRFDDKVTIVFPTKDATSNYYINFGVEKPKPKKRLFSWLR